MPALEAHRPELLYVSAGFDAHREDPLAGLEAHRGRLCVGHARAGRAWPATHAKGRIVSTLEGGYALGALGRSVAEHIRELLVAA